MNSLRSLIGQTGHVVCEVETDVADFVHQIVAQFREGVNETPRAFVQQIERFDERQLAGAHVAGFQIGEDRQQIFLAQMIGQQVSQARLPERRAT